MLGTHQNELLPPTSIAAASAADEARHTTPSPSNSEASGASSGNDSTESQPRRPKLPKRKSSGTMVVPRDSTYIDIVDEKYDESDARAMSPRRSSDEIDRMSEDARLTLQQQARALQESLVEILDRVEIVKSEHEKLEGGNKFLQSYIGELMQTSKITMSTAVSSVGSTSGKGSKGRKPTK